MDERSNYMSDSKIICFMIPYDQTKLETQDISSILSDMSSSNGVDMKLYSLKENTPEENRNSENVQMNVLTDESANDSKVFESKVSPKYSKSRIKRKSKYADIYACGNTEFVRQNPKRVYMSKSGFHEPCTLQKLDLLTKNATNQGNQFGCETSIKPPSKRLHTNEKSFSRCNIFCDSKQSTDNTYGMKDVDDESSNVQFVHKLINFLINPKTKHHQNCAITILRHDEKLRQIFQRERHLLGRQKIPVFRQKKDTEFAISDNAAEQYLYHHMQDDSNQRLDQVSLQSPVFSSSSLRSPTSTSVSTTSSAGSATSLNSGQIEILPSRCQKDNLIEQCQLYDGIAMKQPYTDFVMKKSEHDTTLKAVSLSEKPYYTISDDALQSTGTSPSLLQPTGLPTDSLCLNVEEENAPNFSSYFWDFN